MAENREKRIEQLKKELEIRKGIAECNKRFVKEIEKAIEALENEGSA